MSNKLSDNSTLQLVLGSMAGLLAVGCIGWGMFGLDSRNTQNAKQRAQEESARMEFFNAVAIDRCVITVHSEFYNAPLDATPKAQPPISFSNDDATSYAQCYNLARNQSVDIGAHKRNVVATALRNGDVVGTIACSSPKHCSDTYKPS